MGEVFPPYCFYFFNFGYLQEEKRDKSWTKSANFGFVPFPYILESPPNIFKTVFLIVRVLRLVRISAILDHIGGVRAQKPPKRADSWILTRNAKLFFFN